MNIQKKISSLFLSLGFGYIWAAYYILQNLNGIGSRAYIWVPVFLVSAVICAAAGFYPRSQLLRIAAFLAFFLCMDILFDDPVRKLQLAHLWIYALAVFACTSNRFIENGFHAARIVILSTYLFAGLWKLGSIFIYDYLLHHIDIITAASEMIAGRALEGGHFVGILTDTLVAHPGLSLFGYAVVACVQILVLPLYLNKRFRVYVPYLLIAFHLTVYLSMRISFFADAMALLILFILPDILERQQTEL